MKSIKPVVGLILVFILGAASGSLVTYMVLQTRMETVLAGGPRAREDVLITRLSRQLDLDSRQREQVKAIIHETHEDMRQIRQKTKPEIEALLTDSQLRISALLRPEQQEKFKKIVAERKSHRQFQNR
jgi:Spy/CpxP family protein refolding chaperone